MKITRDTPDQLIVEDRPWLFALMIIVFTLIFLAAGLMIMAAGDLMGLFFALVGGGMGLLAFWAFVRRVQVVFHRPDGYVELRRKSIFRQTRVRHDLSEVSQAIVQQTSGGDSGTLLRVSLVIPSGQSAGTHPLTNAYSNIGNHRGICRRINEWLYADRDTDPPDGG